MKLRGKVDKHANMVSSLISSKLSCSCCLCSSQMPFCASRATLQIYFSQLRFFCTPPPFPSILPFISLSSLTPHHNCVGGLPPFFISTITSSCRRLNSWIDPSKTQRTQGRRQPPSRRRAHPHPCAGRHQCRLDVTRQRGVWRVDCLCVRVRYFVCVNSMRQKQWEQRVTEEKKKHRLKARRRKKWDRVPDSCIKRDRGRERVRKMG